MNTFPFGASSKKKDFTAENPGCAIIPAGSLDTPSGAWIIDTVGRDTAGSFGNSENLNVSFGSSLKKLW